MAGIYYCQKCNKDHDMRMVSELHPILPASTKESIRLKIKAWGQAAKRKPDEGGNHEAKS